MGEIIFTEEIDIDAPAAAAWAVVADYTRDVEWRTGVVNMVPAPLGPVRVGTTTAEEMKLGGKRYRNDGEVIAVEPGASFSWRTVRGAVAHGSRTVQPRDDGGCRVRLALHVTPTGPDRLFTPILERMLRRALAADAGALRRLVERSAVPRAGAPNEGTYGPAPTRNRTAGRTP